MDEKPLRIALISEHASPLATIGGVDAGGQNVYVSQVASCLARAGHHVDVLTRRESPDQPPMVDVGPGVRVFHVTAGPAAVLPKEQLLPHMREFALSSEQLLRHSLPHDLVHANFFMSGIVAQYLKRRRGLPHAITFHALGLVRRLHQRDTDAFPPQRAEIERRLMQQADAVIAECPQDSRDMQTLYGASTDNLFVVPCGFDPDEFAPMDRGHARRQLGIPEHEFVVLQLGRLVPRKGIDNVIAAVGLLPPGRPVRLLVVGGESADPEDGRTPEILRLRTLAAAHDVADRVTFVGHRQREQLRLYYAAADVFVTTPWYEPFGITPLEAMGCGLPVIGSAVGGIQHTVREGITGFLVPPKNPQALARRLQLLRTSAQLATSLGQAGLLRARQSFTWERVVDQLLPIYRLLVLRGGAKPDRVPLKLVSNTSAAGLSRVRQSAG